MSDTQEAAHQDGSLCRPLHQTLSDEREASGDREGAGGGEQAGCRSLLSTGTAPVPENRLVGKQTRAAPVLSISI